MLKHSYLKVYVLRTYIRHFTTSVISLIFVLDPCKITMIMISDNDDYFGSYHKNFNTKSWILNRVLSDKIRNMIYLTIVDLQKYLLWILIQWFEFWITFDENTEWIFILSKRLIIR